MGKEGTRERNGEREEKDEKKAEKRERRKRRGTWLPNTYVAFSSILFNAR